LTCVIAGSWEYPDASSHLVPGEIAVKALVWVLAALATSLAAPLAAQDDLEQRVRALEEQLAKAKAAEPVAATAGEKGFAIRSADGSFEFKLKGLLQVDGRFFTDDEQGLADTWLLRRVEPTFELTLGKLAFFKLQPQFAGDSAGTADVYGELRFHPAAGVRFGKFKTPLGLEYLQASAPLMLVERGYPTEVGAGRDLGLQLQGELLGGTTSYAIAYLDGAADGRDAASTDTDNRKEAAARVFVEPFRNGDGPLKGLGVGVGATRGKKAGAIGTLTATTAAYNNTLPRYRSPGQNTIFAYRIVTTGTPTAADTAFAAGDHTRLSPQLYYYAGSFGLLAEHMSSKQDVSFNGAVASYEHTAWQVQASYLLTGEAASYKGSKPNAPYAAGGPGWGAFEVAVRHGVLDPDDDAFTDGAADPAKSVTEATTNAVALSWYLNANARLVLDYEKTSFDGGDAAGDRRDEKLLLTRVQLAF
jgi:phosphate-selective porin OprO and OprP